MKSTRRKKRKKESKKDESKQNENRGMVLDMSPRYTIQKYLSHNYKIIRGISGRYMLRYF